MSFAVLFLIAIAGAFAVVYLLAAYVPLQTSTFGIKWSPRLFITKRLLGPADAVLTLILIGGSWIGFTSVIGISSTVYNVLTGIGISMGVQIAKKLLYPHWKKEYDKLQRAELESML